MNSQEVDELVADGTISEGEAEEIRKFVDFLKLAGPPGSGKIGKRLLAAGRPDLLEWAMGKSR